MGTDMEKDKEVGLDGTDILSLLEKRKKNYIRIGMSELQEYWESTEPKFLEYETIRKIVLDMMNDYVRSIERALIGPVED